MPEKELFLRLLDIAVRVIKDSQVGKKFRIREKELRIDIRKCAVPHFAGGRQWAEFELGKVGDRIVGSTNRDIIIGMEYHTRLFNGATNAMHLLENLRAEETDTSFWDMQTRQLNNMGFSIHIFDGPENNTFTINFILTGEVLDFHFAGPICPRLEI
jgi:hypothetical protein